MKCILIALFVVFNPIGISAQKHHLFADAGISLSRFYPGFSTTYNYNLAKWFGLGIGVQGYPLYPTMTNTHQFVPGVFGDLRFPIRAGKKNQFFTFLDIGIDFYKHSNKYYQKGNVIYDVRKDNGLYTGFGLGYFRRMTIRGGGPYILLKTVSNSYKANGHNIVSQEQKVETWSRGTLVVSLGFRF